MLKQLSVMLPNATLAAVAAATPTLVVNPLAPPLTAVGFRPAIQLDAAVVLGDDIKGIFGDYLEGQAGVVTISESSPAGGVVEAALGFEWRVCSRVIEGRVFADFNGACMQDGDYTELLAVAMIDSPNPDPQSPVTPRFELTEAAAVRITWDASDHAFGSLYQHNLSVVLMDPDAPPPGNLLFVVTHSGGPGAEPWSDSGTIDLNLDAGTYDLRASVSQQGTMLQPSQSGFNLTMGGQTSVSFRVEVLVPPACAADVTNDGVVNFDDLNLVLSHWSEADAPGDTDCSGHVDFDDLNSVLNAWEQTRTP
ncbi:MAG: hypothetical protein KDA21_08465 [Phycisphaerales bacterium]|nr:hypothetical protein [Phycisphaerales bacterium]